LKSFVIIGTRQAYVPQRLKIKANF